MRVVLDPPSMRSSATRLDNAASEVQTAAIRVATSSLPTMPPSVAALVSDTIARTSTDARIEALRIHDVASEVRLRARLGELAGAAGAWPSVLLASGGWLGDGLSGMFGPSGLAWALVAGWDGYRADVLDDGASIPLAIDPTTSAKTHHGSWFADHLKKAVHVAPGWVTSHAISLGGSAVAVKGVVVRDVGGPFMSVATREIPYATRVGLGAAAGAGGQLVADASKNLSAEARAGRALVAGSAGVISTIAGVAVGGSCEAGAVVFTAGSASGVCWVLGTGTAAVTGWALNKYVAPKIDHAAGWEPRPTKARTTPQASYLPLLVPR